MNKKNYTSFGQANNSNFEFKKKQKNDILSVC